MGKIKWWLCVMSCGFAIQGWAESIYVTADTGSSTLTFCKQHPYVLPTFNGVREVLWNGEGSLYTTHTEERVVAKLLLPSGEIVRSKTDFGEPRGLVLSRDKRFVFVVDKERSQVVQLDAKDLSLIRKFSTLTGPRNLCLNSSGTLLFVTNNESNSVGAYDLVTNSWHWISPIATPYALCFCEEDQSLYVTSIGDNAVYRIDHELNVRETLMGFNHPSSLCLHNGFLYVACMDGDHIAVWDLKKKQMVERMRTKSKPFGLALATDEEQLAVSCHGAAVVEIFDLKTREKNREVKIGQQPHGICRIK